MWQLALTTVRPAELDHVMLFGFLASVATLVCWRDQHQSIVLRMLYGPCLAALASYGFLAGAWPLGLVMGFASTVASYRSWKELSIAHRRRRFAVEFRVGRLFGSDDPPYTDSSDEESGGRVRVRHPPGSNN